jgi:eukaryotic-like serine/threonine-protein kinase
MNDQSENAKSIFLDAIERHSPDQWAAFLDQACAGNNALKLAVEKLLRAQLEIGSFHEEPRQSETLDEPMRDGPGTVIGTYKLLELIGEGGFGIVFMAEQMRPIRRKVALKILKPGMDTRQVVARFEAERQALALMDHANIAHVFDGGETESGRPYFVMELVRGIAITEFCDQNHLDIRERLKLFVEVCQAVQHAHQKGVIHRDLKPSNVLVTMHDNKAVVKVIDFGIAKATGQLLTEKTLFTNFAQMIGTPMYMSPEQAQMSGLDVDTRSDIYSLGVLLYELLTGTTPFDKERLHTVGFDEIRRIIREEEPARPSTRLSTVGQAATTASANRRSDPRRLSQLFRGELDWVVMKCLEKDRGRRYETVTALADDVERYLRNETVTARPPTAAYRFRKFAGRHKAGLATATVTGTALIVGAAVATWQAWRAIDAENQTRAQLLEKNKQFERAEANFLKTLEAVDQLLTEVGQRDLASIPHLEQVRRRLLEKALKFFEEFLSDRGNNPDVRFEAGIAYCRVGDIRRLLGQQGPAEEACTRAIKLLSELRDTDPERTRFRFELARAYSSRAALFGSVGRRHDAEQDYGQSHSLLSTLAVEDPDRPEFRAELGMACSRWGMLLQTGGSRQQAEPLLREGVQQLNEVVARVPDRSDFLKTLAKSNGNLANLLSDSGRRDEAEQAYRRQFEIVANAQQRFSDDVEFRLVDVLNHMNYGRFLWRSGRLGNAESEFRTAADLGDRLVADFPAIPEYRLQVAGVFGNWGGMLVSTGRASAAEPFLKQAVARFEKLADDFPNAPKYHSGAGGALNNLAMLLWHTLKRPAEARVLLEKALQHQQMAHAIDPRDRIYREYLRNHAGNLALILKGLHAPADEVDAAFERAIDLSRALAADYPEIPDCQSDLGSDLSNLAVLWRERGQFERAASLASEAIAQQRAALKLYPSHPQYLGFLSAALLLQAEILGALDRPEAEAAYRGLVATATDLATVSTSKSAALLELAKTETALADWLERHGNELEAGALREQARRHEKEAAAAAGAAPAKKKQ